jgi:hypothetical protein
MKNRIRTGENNIRVKIIDVSTRATNHEQFVNSDAIVNLPLGFGFDFGALGNIGGGIMMFHNMPFLTPLTTTFTFLLFLCVYCSLNEYLQSVTLF